MQTTNNNSRIKENMGENIYETWSAGKGYIYLYTENDMLYNLLKKITNNFAKYERRGKVFGWQFLLPKEKLEFIKAEIKKNKSIEK
jgi:hypothetical protein